MAASRKLSPPSFILTNGGPVDHLLARLRLRSPTRKQIASFIMIGWLPLLLLSALQGIAIGQSVRVPFLLDIGEQVRLLLVVPLLLMAEPIISASVREAVEQFHHEQLVLEEEEKLAFDNATHRAMRWKESALAEVILVGVVIVLTFAQLDTIQKTVGTSWLYPRLTASSNHPGHLFLTLSLAGKWLALVGLPIYRFLLLRWIWRFIIWTGFLWQVSRLRLQLIPTHPDRAGGLAFLADTQLRFAVLLFAASAVVASAMANLIVYEGKSPLQFKLTVFWFIAFAVLIVLLPLFSFTTKLIALKEEGQLEYGQLSMTYSRSFQQKWLGSTSPSDPLLGNDDIQSLADMSKSFSIIREMRIVPFDYKTIKYLVLATILPFLPLLLAVVPLQELWQKTRDFLL
ncbi:MAG TPA: hypothetical protein V6C46_08945 [Coleofasciculaceae cyanobacterium]